MFFNRFLLSINLQIYLFKPHFKQSIFPIRILFKSNKAKNLKIKKIKFKNLRNEIR